MNKEKSEKEKLIEFLQLCLRNWYWFIGIFTICLVLGLVYYKTTEPVWDISAKVSLSDDDILSGKGISQSQSLMSAFGVGGGKQNVEDETNKMSSHGFIKKTVKNLELNKVYYQSKSLGLIKKDLYEQSPVMLSVDPSIADTLSSIIEFAIEISGENAKVKMEFNKQTIGKYEIKSFPAILETPLGEFTFSLSPYFPRYNRSINLEILFTSYDFMAQVYMENLDIIFEKKNSDIINLSMLHKNTQFAKKILREIISVYNETWREDKAMVTDKTIQFINDRLNLVKTDLELADARIQSFKGKNQLTDIEADVTFYMEVNAELQGKLIEAETQLKLVDIIHDFVKDEDKKYELMPFSAVTLDPALAEVVVKYNEELLIRNELSRSAKVTTSTLESMNEQIEYQRKNLLQSLTNIKKGMIISLNELKAKEKEILSKISNVPAVEKEFVNLKREQELQQAIYIFLVEKREETMIKAVSLMPKLKIIDNPYVINKPVSPDFKKIALIIMFFGGFVLPLGAIYAAPHIMHYFRNRKKDDL
ncbi:MAG: hypothetical protein LBF79_04975 [Dysgonamonadaceae bacterium]|jgi:uncharacterized protein involved in exopolysaccharide biosynthesis|nr:hypothetical protein [Dysgonamonadaceae bacterium]